MLLIINITFQKGRKQMDNFTPETTTAVVEEKKPFPVLGLISLICSVVGILIGCTCCTPVGMVLGIAAVVLAIIERVKLGKFSGLALAGLIAGAAALVLSIVSAVGGAVIGASMPTGGYYY